MLNLRLQNKGKLMMKRKIFFILAVLLCTASCSVMNKKPAVKDTSWKSEYGLFVADAGTENVTVTLKFGAKNDYVMRTVSVMPSYPAMYMDENGKCPMMPGWSRESTTHGTYSVAPGKVILTEEDGTAHTLYYAEGKLESPDLAFEPIAFTREDEKVD